MYDEQMSDADGWGGYPDQRSGMGAIAGYESMQGLAYAPNLGPVGSKTSYFPGDISADVDALEYLGYLTPGTSIKMSFGNQGADMANQAGGWDPVFRSAITSFQGSHGLTADGWVGPATRQAMLNAVNAKNASESPITPPYSPPNVPVAPGVPPYTPPSLPTPTPGGGAIQPASTGGKDNTTMYVAAGVGALVLGGVAIWALMD